MKKFELTKEQLSYLHSIDSVKERIEEWFPSEFPKLEAGKWYIYPNGAIQFNKKDGIGYGIQSNGNWVNTSAWLGIKHNGNFRLATPKEVKEALTKEAVKRGFKEGVRFKRVNSVTCKCENTIDIIKDDLIWNGEGLITSCDYIFSNGVWAEIISEPIEVTLEEIAKLKGVDVSLIKIVM